MQRGLEGFTDKPHFAFLERHKAYRLKAAKQHWRESAVQQRRLVRRM